MRFVIRRFCRHASKYLFWCPEEQLLTLTADCRHCRGGYVHACTWFTPDTWVPIAARQPRAHREGLSRCVLLTVVSKALVWLCEFHNWLGTSPCSAAAAVFKGPPWLYGSFYIDYGLSSCNADERNIPDRKVCFDIDCWRMDTFQHVLWGDVSHCLGVRPFACLAKSDIECWIVDWTFLRRWPTAQLWTTRSFTRAI